MDLPWVCVVCHSGGVSYKVIAWGPFCILPPPSLSASLLCVDGCVYSSSCRCVSDSQWAFCIDKWTVSVEQCSSLFSDQQGVVGSIPVFHRARLSVVLKFSKKSILFPAYMLSCRWQIRLNSGIFHDELVVPAIVVFKQLSGANKIDQVPLYTHSWKRKLCLCYVEVRQKGRYMQLTSVFSFFFKCQQADNNYKHEQWNRLRYIPEYSW